MLLSAALALPSSAAPAYRVLVKDLRVVDSPVDPTPSDETSQTETGALVLDQSAVAFGSVNLTSPAATKVLTATNVGDSTIEMTRLAVTGSAFSALTTCPQFLTPQSSCEILVSAKPASGGPAAGELTVGSKSNSPKASLSVTGVSGLLQVTPSSVSFGTLNLGELANQSIRVQNSGSDTVSLSAPGMQAASGVSVAASTCLSSLGPGGACTYTLTWAPAKVANLAGSFTVRGDVEYPVELVGNVNGAVLVASPTAVQVQSDEPKSLQVMNVGNRSAVGVSVSSQTPAVQTSSTCPALLAPGAQCTVTVTASAAHSSGFIQVQHSTGSALVEVTNTAFSSGTGPGQNVVSISPSYWTFATTSVGSASEVQRFLVSNKTSSAVTLLGFEPLPDFIFDTSGCYGLLAAGASCTVSATFKPVSIGFIKDRTRLVYRAEGASTPKMLSLQVSGMALGGLLGTYSSIADFRQVSQFTPNARVRVPVYNQGNAPISLGPLTGTVSGVSHSSTCPASLAPGETCELLFLLDTSSLRELTGSYAFMAGTRQAVVQVRGAVVPASLTLSSTVLAFGDVELGNTAVTRQVQVRNESTVALSGLSISTTGEFASSTDCTSTLPAGQQCLVTVWQTAPSTGRYSGALSVQAGSLGASVTLSANVVLKGPTLSSTRLSFLDALVGQLTAPQQVLVSNPYSEPLELGALTLVGAATFQATHNCPVTLPVGGDCVLSVRYAPQVDGSELGELTARGLRLRLQGETLAGSGAGQSGLAATPASVAFGVIEPFKTATSRTVTLTNVSQATATLAPVTLDNSQAFSVSSGCGQSLAPGASCTLTVSAFTNRIGEATGRIGVKTSTGELGLAVSADVDYQPKLEVSPSTVDFGLVDRGYVSDPRTVRVHNAGTADLFITSIQPKRNIGNVLVSHDCPASLPPSTGCDVSLALRIAQPPVDPEGAVEILPAEPLAPVSVSLRATPLDTTATLTPAENIVTAFSETELGAKSLEKSFTLTNTGTGRLKVLSSEVSTSDFEITRSTCGPELLAGASCELFVRFAPQQQGVRTANLTIGTTIPNLMLSRSLSGVAVQSFATSTMVFEPKPVLFQAVPTSDTTSTGKLVTLTNTNAFGVTLGGFTASDAALSVSAGSCEPDSVLSAGQSCSFTVNFRSSEPTTLGSQVVTLGLLNPAASVSVAIEGAQALAQAPVLDSVTPSNVLSGSNTSITLTGAHFYQDARVFVGGQLTPARWRATRKSTTTFELNAQDIAPGTYSLSVVNSAGQSQVKTWTVAPAPTSGFSTSSTSLQFPDTPVGSYSTLSVQVLNTGSTPLSNWQLTSPAPFSATHNCAELAKDQSCTVSVTFTPALVGPNASLPLSISSGGVVLRTVSLSGAGVSPVSVSASSLGFGGVPVGGPSAEQSVQFQNIGGAPVGVTLVSVSGPYTARHNCPAQLQGGAFCVVTVAFSPTTKGLAAGSLALVLDSSATVSVALSGEGLQAVGALTATPSADFGAVAVGESVSRTFVFTNTGNFEASNLVANTQGFPGLVLTQNTCGSASTPAGVPPGGTCQVTLTWTPTASSSLAGERLTVSGALKDGSVFLALAGSAAGFDASAAWSTTVGGTTPTGAFLAYSTQTPAATTETKTFYLRNTGTSGAMAASFALTGDTRHFRISATPGRVTNGNTAWNSCGSTKAADGLSTTPCTAQDPALGAAAQKHIVLQVTYAPLEAGSHVIQVVPTSANGAGMPQPLSFTGASVSNPVGAWSTSLGANLAPTAQYLTFERQTTGVSSQNIQVLLRNTGTNGKMRASFRLVGDTQHFKFLSNALKVTNSSWSGYACGATLSADKLSADGCSADDPKVATAIHMLLTVQYAPQSDGNHTVQLVAVGEDDTVVPAPLTFTGSSAFNPTAAWSTSPSAVVTPTSSTLAFTAQTPGVTSEVKRLFLRNVGTNGAMQAALRLEGDTQHFRIEFLYKNSSGTFSGAPCGGTVAADGLSTGTCSAQDIKDGAYANMTVSVIYAPQSTGSHSVQLVPTTTNATTLPPPVTLTGTAVFNAAGAWTTSSGGVTAPSSSFLNYGTLVAGSGSANKSFILRQTGTNGALRAGIQLVGDTAHFKLAQVPYKNSGGSFSGVLCGATLAADKLSASVCAAEDPKLAVGYTNILVVLTYAPTAKGTHSIQVVPSSDNGSALPAALSFTGVGN